MNKEYKTKEEAEEFIKEFTKFGKDLTLEDLKRIEDESYYLL